MGKINSVYFDAETISRKPAWLRRQLGLLADADGSIRADPTPPTPVTLPEPPKPAKRAPRPQKQARKRVARSRNGNTWTEAAYWGTLRSGLRRLFRFWKPAIAALHAARIPCKGPNGQKWAYLCADCGKVFPRKQVQIDHRDPVGRLLAYEDLPGFVARLTPESPDAYACRCLTCHQLKTNTERAKS